MCEFCYTERAITEVTEARHPRETEWFFSELRILRERWNVLTHPFYVRWSAGILSHRELHTYAEEYDHLVVALAVASRRAADKAPSLLRDALREHAEEEHAHIGLWRTFAKTARSHAGVTSGEPADPARATVECARAWAGDQSRALAGDLVTLYAIDSPQPEIARTKLAGLLGSYGFDDGAGTEYFRLHAERDKDHAALAQSALEALLPAEDPFALLTQAEAVHRGYWLMLDGLEQAHLT